MLDRRSFRLWERRTNIKSVIDEKRLVSVWFLSSLLLASPHTIDKLITALRVGSMIVLHYGISSSNKERAARDV
jgi:hypothetical protein